jgi:hypothetical protein
VELGVLVLWFDCQQAKGKEHCVAYALYSATAAAAAGYNRCSRLLGLPQQKQNHTTPAETFAFFDLMAVAEELSTAVTAAALCLFWLDLLPSAAGPLMECVVRRLHNGTA